MSIDAKAILDTLAGLVEKTAGQGDFEKDLADIAYHSVIVVMKIKAEEERAAHARQLAEALRYKNGTGDTSLLEKYIREHPPSGA